MNFYISNIPDANICSISFRMIYKIEFGSVVSSPASV